MNTSEHAGPGPRTNGGTAPSRTASTLLTSLAAAGGAPRLTWYGEDAERVELSGAVLVNWVTKSTNLLVEEFDLGPGGTVVLDLPAHWRAVIWALAVWNCGGTARMSTSHDTPDTSDSHDTHDTSGPRAEAVVTTRPAAWTAAPGRPDVVAVELGALARRFSGDLPPRAVDAASAVMTYSDALGYVPPVDPARDALVVGPSDDTAAAAAATVSHADLVAWGAAGPAGREAPGARTLVVARDAPGLLRDALGTWARGGSLVAVVPSVADLDRTDPDRWRRLRDGERVDADIR